MKFKLSSVIVILILAVAVSGFAAPSGFGSHFQSYLNSHGYSFPYGGFGGYSYKQSISKPVIVFVHGNGSRAQGCLGDPNGWKNQYDYFKARGWKDTELYAINYPKPVLYSYQLIPVPQSNHHSSDRINLVKNFIKAVYYYTGRQVVVIAHSLGCTITRKAMLEGNLYSKVKTFISIAGANHGLASCGYWYWGFYFCVSNLTCSRSTGFCNYPFGSVSDTFIRALNSSTYGDNEMRYKSTRTYVILSTMDELNVTTSTPKLAGAYKTKIFSIYGYGHYGVKDKSQSLYVQYKMALGTY